MTDAVDVRAAAAGFDRSAVAEEDARADEDRRSVLAQFPLQDWPTLPLERYALGQEDPDGGMTYCRLMEFGTQAMGSIKGGSAAKHIMYRHNSGEWRLAGPFRGLDPRAA